MVDKGLFTLQGQYHGCWWPGDGRSQGISNHGSDPVILEYAVSTPEGLNFYTKKTLSSLQNTDGLVQENAIPATSMPQGTGASAAVIIELVLL